MTAGDRCPRCGRHLEQPSPAAAIADQLVQACIARGISRSFDNHIREKDAAALLGMSSYTLRNWRMEGSGRLPHRRVGKFAEYALADLAAYLAAE